jgi:hypothetical protein
MFAMEAYDEPWKANYNDYPSLGLWDSSGNLKPGMATVFEGGGTSTEGGCDPSSPIGGAGTPTITFTSVPVIGSTNNLTGQVAHVASASDNVFVVIYVDGNWWLKPYADSPLTPINCDGTWSADIVTGGDDTQATVIDAFVIPLSYSPPGTGDGLVGPTLPQDLFQNAAAYTSVTRAP